jgi:hypothetical protein
MSSFKKTHRKYDKKIAKRTFEVTVVEGDANTVQFEALEKGGVFLLEEVFEELKLNASIIG